MSDHPTREFQVTSDHEAIRSPSPSFVVGIGASAGGLESLEKLFRNMPTDLGMAFVVIQHLSPDFKSMMNELLARDTSMQIIIAEDGIRVEANVIYLMPPKKQMIVADGRLHLSDKDPGLGLSLPIDHFLESLAREYQSMAIAAILSGSGTDGTRGVAEVSKRGGLVISESLDTAKFDGMPSSAQATGFVDWILHPEEIGNALLTFQEDPGSLPRAKPGQGSPNARLQGLDAIIDLFRRAYDIDFASYKDSTVLRRIQRRRDMANLETLDAYARRLESDTEELHILYGDLLIGVTQFFRDPETFKHLREQIFPDLIRRCKDELGIRAWVAGCATGEEAYSVAIAFQEAMRTIGCQLPFKLFATDIHKKSIEHASRGFFKKEVMQAVNPEHLERYFLPRKEGYQIRPELRQMIVFAPHNVLQDAPFTDLHFVSCRNLLIYLRPSAQRRALSLFHYGLEVGGVLLLGGSESTGELAGEFEVLSERSRLYRKSRDVRLLQNLRSPLSATSVLSSNVSALTPPQHRPNVSTRGRQIQDQLLDRHMPPSILIDSSRKVIETFAGAERYLHFPSRHPSLDILDLVVPSIRTTLSGAIMRAAKEQKIVRFGKIPTVDQDGSQSIDLSVEPLIVQGDDPCYLIMLKDETGTLTLKNVEQQTIAPESELSELAVSQDHIRQLEDELKYSRENLQATIEELETSNEELQATNEELIASNEELQSTNEELHSLNEELYSVNSEHQRKIDELAVLNRDMNHLLENTEVAMVFLDERLCIRRFTSRVDEIFELIDEDVGRSIHAFAAKLPLENLILRLQTVLETGQPYEQEVCSSDGTIYLMRLLPYRIGDTTSGVVVMWVDISSVEALRGRLRWLSAIVESTNDAIIGQDLEGRITSWNSGAEALYGYNAKEIIGQSILSLIPADRHDEVGDYHEKILQGETVHSLDTVRIHRDGTSLLVSLTVSPVLDSAGQVIGISKIARDISTRIRMEQEIRKQVAQREHFLAMLSHELRNPFHAIRSAAAIVSDTRSEPQSQQLATGIIARQVGVVNHLLTDLLDVARISGNRINLSFETFDLRELTKPVEEMVQFELDRHQCTVDFETQDAPCTVRGDRTRLTQVLVNLIHNAAKYSESHNPILVNICKESEYVRVTVSDQGRGIPPEELDSIFEAFSQLDQSLSKSDGGLGIGLTLAKSLTELHEGSLYAESAGLGQGSSFHILLPRTTEAPHVEQKDGIGANPQQTPQTTQIQAGPLRICVVEDMHDSREMFRMLLEMDGHQVSTVPDGRSAIDFLTSNEVDLALVDIGLPDMSGYDVAEAVRQESQNSCMLIALTGYGQPSDVQKAMNSGFDDHIIKPLDPKQLQEIILRFPLAHSAADRPYDEAR